MTPEQIATLKSHVAATSALAAMAIVGNDAELVAAFAAPHRDGPWRGRLLTERGVLDVLGGADGDAFLAAIEAFANATNNSLLKRTLRIMQDINADGGIDFGNAELQEQLQGLAQAGVITPQSATKLIAYGTRKWSLAEHLVGEGAVVTAEIARRLR